MKNTDRLTITISITILAAALLTVAALRVDATILAFALGLLCGLVVGVPPTALVTLLLTRQRDNGAAGLTRQRHSQQPQILVIPPAAYTPPASPPWGATPPVPQAPALPARQFTVIGDED